MGLIPQAAEYKTNDLERSIENIQIGTHQEKRKKKYRKEHKKHLGLREYI